MKGNERKRKGSSSGGHPATQFTERNETFQLQKYIYFKISTFLLK